mgnify:CR=1 FL=1
MITVQEMSARIGRISNKGLAGNMKKHYPELLQARPVQVLPVINWNLASQKFLFEMSYGLENNSEMILRS